MSKRKICVITGTRAEYGLLSNLMREIKPDPDLELQIIATGMHLSPEFGLTYQEIEGSGFRIDKKIEMLLSSDTPVGVAKSMGLAMIGFADAYEELKPDIIVLLGDRFETFCAASVACVMQIPLSHIHGGEITIGAIDDALRHSITKMAYLHFTSTEGYRQRVIQLGENPERVFNVGSLGVESIGRLNLLSREELEKSMEFKLGKRCILVTYHPETLSEELPEEQFKNLVDAIDCFHDLRVIFTKANADAGGRVINSMIDDYVAKNSSKTISFTSMGQIRYFSAMKYVNAVVGNSSSGIIEAPGFFCVPTVNIGNRQEGRERSRSIIDCSSGKSPIVGALSKAFSEEFRQEILDVDNPHKREGTARNIKEIIKGAKLNDIIRKDFFDIERNT